MTQLAHLIEPEQLESLLDKNNIVVIDLCQAKVHQQLHIPNAIPLDYAQIVAGKKPVFGLLPEIETISQVLSSIGIDADTQVIAYDDEGGGKAARLQWTLDALGHEKHSMLNGGIHSWANEGFPVTKNPSLKQPKTFIAKKNENVIADANYLLPKLNDNNLKLVDTRSLAEYDGSQRYSQKAGHIPNAIHWDWSDAIDQSNNMRMRPAQELLDTLANFGIEKSNEVITYCQTHHRSSYTYIMLKTLGFKQLRGYHGAWSEWGNRSDTPIE